MPAALTVKLTLAQRPLLSREMMDIITFRSEEVIRTVSHTTFSHNDAAKTRAFYLDFGLHITHENDDAIYFRGNGTRPYIYVIRKGDDSRFISVSYEADSEDALKEASRRFGVPIRQLNTPWGGQVASTHDIDGNEIEVIWGIQQLPPIPTREPLHFNSGGKSPRLGRFPVLHSEPCPVLHLCHVVHHSPKPSALIDWYINNLDAYPSDTLINDDGEIFGAFLRFPAGEKYVPHHNVAVFEGPAQQVQHVSFEALDLDSLQLGNNYLREKNYRPGWGPVRHVLGGAISDYWHDPSGFRAEHVTDGDLLNDKFPTQISRSEEESLMAWGPKLPEDFLVVHE
jgi:catechol 2,3-dioxygenase-like lactoylglutathione lyase family enzyme